jgi:hypothetical protein
VYRFTESDWPETLAGIRFQRLLFPTSAGKSPPDRIPPCLPARTDLLPATVFGAIRRARVSPSPEGERGFRDRGILVVASLVVSRMGRPTGGDLSEAIASPLERAKVKKLYVGNLPFRATDDEVQQLFGQHGEVHSVALINDRETGRPRGFGFVEMDDEGATKAMQALDGYEMMGRALRVNEAQERRGGPRGGGGGGGGRY